MEKNQRKLKNFYIDAPSQSRFVSTTIGALLILTMTFFTFGQYWLVSVGKNILHESGLPVSIQKDVLDSFELLSLYLGLFLFLHVVVLVAILIMQTHRIFGPMVPIRRYVREQLLEQRNESPIRLRKGDFFNDLALDLNTLGERLFGSTPEAKVELEGEEPSKK